MVPQTKLYSQQKGHVLHIEAEEIKALIWNQYGNGVSCSCLESIRVLESTCLLNLILVFLLLQK